MTRICTRRSVLLLAIVIASAVTTAAQSGRRGTTKSTTPNTAPVSDAKVPQSPAQKTSRLQFFAAVEEPAVFDRVPYYLYTAALDECVRRLNEAQGVVATTAPRNMTRGEAVKTAKAEGDKFLVWLEIGSDVANTGRQIYLDSDELFVRYTVFEPGTAKIKLTGRAQYAVGKVGNVGVGLPPSARRANPGYVEYVLKQSAREAAEQILAAFGIKSGPWPR